MVNFRDLPIKHKLTVIILAACSLVILLISGVILVNEILTFRRGLLHNISTLAKVIGINSTAALAFQDPDTAREILAALSAEPNVLRAAVFTATDEIFATYGAINSVQFAPSGKDVAAMKPYGSTGAVFGFLPAGRWLKDYLDVLQPIFMNGKFIGKIRIRSDLKGLYFRLRWFVGLMGGLMFGLMGLAYLMSSRLQRIISEPISGLAQTMKTVSTRKNYSIRAQKTSNDELGVLIVGFNEMLGQIQVRDEERKGHREQLQEQVRLRTRELRVSEKQKQELLQQQKIQKAYGELVAFLNSIDISRIVEQSLNQIVLQANAQWGAFYLCTEEGGALAFRKSYSPGNDAGHGPNRNDIFLRKSRELAQQAFRNHAPIVSEWDITGPGGAPDTVKATGYPLWFQEKPLGVMIVTGIPEFTPLINAFLENAVRQLGVAIHNALTFQTLQYKSAQLKQSNLELEKASRMKSDFLANMSHELRTPLNAIIGFAEILVDKHFGELNEVQEEYLQDVLSSGKHLLALINDILDLSKVEAGKMELDLQPVEIEKLLAGSLTMIKEKAMKNGIQLSMDVAQIPENISADERKVKQIVFNLLSNAVKFTPSGGSIQIGATVVDRQWLQLNVPPGWRDDLLPVLQDQSAAYLKVSVIDTGIGIRAESIQKIFGVFEQEESSTSRKYGGTGLGLNLTQKFLELHHGGIWAESQLGRGSTFSFVLPFKEFASGTESMPEKPVPFSAGPPPKRAKPLVLVVDDDEKIHRHLFRLLEGQGCRIKTVMDGQTAVDVACDTLPDLILLDLILPGQDGWEILVRLKTDARTRHIPIVICSAIEDRQVACDLGAIDCLIKPVAKEDLLRCLSRVGLFPRHNLNGKDILLVDDDPLDRKYYADILLREGLPLRTAATGEEALAMVSEKLPALILQDLLLPNMSGFEMIRRLKATPATHDLPVVVLSAKELSPTERDRLAADIEAFVQKTPDDKGLLLTEIKKLLEIAHEPENNSGDRRQSTEHEVD